jgi:hypothetical protein
MNHIDPGLVPSYSTLSVSPRIQELKRGSELSELFGRFVLDPRRYLVVRPSRDESGVG